MPREPPAPPTTMQNSELDLALTEEQAMLRQTVRDFAAGNVAPRHEALDHAGKHPEDVVQGIAELGLFGVLAPAEAGGAGMGTLAHALAVEALGEAAGVVGAIVVAQGIVVDALARAGGRDALVGELASGAKLGAPALLEADPAVVACRAEGEGEAVRLRGKKTLVPFPGRAGAFVVLARDAAGAEGLYLVEAGASGARHETPEATLGLHGMETAALELDGAAAAKLGGRDLVAKVRDGARIAVAALLAGIGRGAIGHAVRYAQERKQFDQPLIAFGAMKERLARASWRVSAARAAVHAAARLRDRGEPHAAAAAEARAFASEAAVSATDDALQVYGGYGYSREYPVERFYRDARFVGFGEAHPATLAADVVAGLVG